MAGTDYRKQQRDLYTASASKPSVVKVPAMRFLMVDGRGDPNGSRTFAQAIEALYAVSYTLKFRLKFAGRGDFAVMPLEGLWWSEAKGGFSLRRRKDWRWTLMIRQPDLTTAALVRAAGEQAAGRRELPALRSVRLERFSEGAAAQILHVGPYAAEGPTIERLHRFVEEQGGALRGRHHEMYFSDPRRTAPTRLRTIIRHPFRPA